MQLSCPLSLVVPCPHLCRARMTDRRAYAFACFGTGIDASLSGLYAGSPPRARLRVTSPSRSRLLLLSNDACSPSLLPKTARTPFRRGVALHPAWRIRWWR
eukprot:1426640-Pleurochrysis_carterae.AAC.4